MAEEKKVPEWQARRARRQAFGIVKTFVYIVILGAIVGLGITHKEEVLKFISNLTSSPEPEAKPKSVQPPLPEAPPPPKQVAKAPPIEPPPSEPAKKPVVVEPSPPAVSTSDEALAKKLIAAALPMFEKFDFQKAHESLAKSKDLKLSKSLRSEVDALHHRAQSFDIATRHVPVADYAIAEMAYVIKLYDEREWRGLKKSEDDQQFVLQEVSVSNPAATGQKILPIPKNEIAKVTPLPLADRQAEFRKLLLTAAANSTLRKSTDYYDLVYLSKRLGLGHECKAFLDSAFHGGNGVPADPNLGESFRREVVRRTIDRAALLMAVGRKRFAEDELSRLLRTLPGYGVAIEEVEAFRSNLISKVKDDFKSTLVEVKPAAPAKPEKVAAKDFAEETIDIASGAVQVKGNVAAASIVLEANSSYEDGLRHYRGFRQGTNGANNQTLHNALECFQKAISLYEKALALDPNNKAIESRQTEASMLAYACRKHATL